MTTDVLSDVGDLPSLIPTAKILGELQAKLDAIMLEYCPDDMTTAQLEEWGRHQGVEDKIREGLAKGRLLNCIERLEQLEGVNLVSDDGGRWAVSGSGTQPVPEEEGFTEVVDIVSFVDPEAWKPTILEALEYFFQQQDEETAVSITV